MHVYTKGEIQCRCQRCQHGDADRLHLQHPGTGDSHTGQTTLTLVVDRARIHIDEKIVEAFRERGGHVMSILKMPANAAKRMSVSTQQCPLSRLERGHQKAQLLLDTRTQTEQTNATEKKNPNLFNTLA